jgi:hypothetical protein
MNNLMLPDERPLSPARFHATARELRRLPQGRRSRWGMTLALAGALVLLSAVAAVGYALITPQERFESVGCYDQASLDGSVAVVGTSERDPAEECRRLWTDGVVGGVDDPVPTDLTACVLPEGGAIGVFPAGPAVCDTLGLQALQDVEVSPDDVSIPRLEAALGRRLPSWEESDECLNSAETRRRAEQVLEDLGAQDWSVTWQGDDADGDVNCGEISSIEVPSRRIALNGVPGPGSEQVRVSRRLMEITGGDCVGDRDEARVVAEQALRDLGLTEWTVDVSDESWDANVPGDIPGEQCASFQYYEPRTVSVESAIHDPEPGWRRFVPGM